MTTSDGDDARAPWQLQPVPASTRTWLLLLVLVLPVAVIVVAMAWGTSTPGPKNLVAGSVWLTNAVFDLGILAICGGTHWFLARALRRHRVGIDGNGLEVATTFYERRLGWNELQPAQARVVDLDEHTELKPMLKTNGTALPGLKSGWFRLRNRRKSLVAIAGGRRVLHLPTTAGYDLLLQPRQPQALLQRLRELAPPRPGG
jgi:hypothetical protein